MNGYLVVAYGFVWGIFTLYAWVITHASRSWKRKLKS